MNEPELSVPVLTTCGWKGASATTQPAKSALPFVLINRNWAGRRCSIKSTSLGLRDPNRPMTELKYAWNIPIGSISSRPSLGGHHIMSLSRG